MHEQKAKVLSYGQKYFMLRLIKELKESKAYSGFTLNKKHFNSLCNNFIQAIFKWGKTQTKNEKGNLEICGFISKLIEKKNSVFSTVLVLTNS